MDWSSPTRSSGSWIRPRRWLAERSWLYDLLLGIPRGRARKSSPAESPPAEQPHTSLQNQCNGLTPGPAVLRWTLQNPDRGWQRVWVAESRLRLRSSEPGANWLGHVQGRQAQTPPLDEGGAGIRSHRRPRLRGKQEALDGELTKLGGDKLKRRFQDQAGGHRPKRRRLERRRRGLRAPVPGN